MIKFGHYEVDLTARELRRHGRPIRLGSRAFDILVLLLSTPGRLVTKTELLATVWPDVVVEDNNVQVQLSALRKALGTDQGCIVTVPGRGYLFASTRTASHASSPASEPQRRNTLPLRRTEIFGREEALGQLRAALASTQLLTLVGAGGVGKTTLAIALAQRIADEEAAQVSFAELAAFHRRDEVHAVLAQSCGLTADALAAGSDALHAFQSGQERLLVIDNAEHVIDHVAALVERMTHGNRELRIVVTSRERLRIANETVFRVEPLAIPAADASEREILEQAAVQLFLSRAKTLGATEIARDQIATVGDICRRLDGIPLAIELAAARTQTFGIDVLRDRLDDRLAILTGGYRTALPRHQTLRATFDWSYRLLDPVSRTLFRRLALFGGTFTLESLCATACDADLTVCEVIDGIGDLVAKSLVNVEFDGPIARYRLTESTRTYARQKLQAEGELELLARRNARYLASRFSGVGPADTVAGEPGRGVDDLDERLDDARTIFDWAFTAHGDKQLGVELAATMSGALMERGLVDECARRAERAIAALDAHDGPLVDALSEMRVRAALATALPHLAGPIRHAADNWRTVMDLAEASGNEEFQVRAFWGLWNTAIYDGTIKDSHVHALRFKRFARERGVPWQRTLARQMVAVTLHCRGHHARAKAQIEAAMRDLGDHPDDAEVIRRVAGEPHAFCYGTLARIFWLEGEHDRAMEYVDKTLNLIGPGSMEPSLTHVLGVLGAPLAFLSGDMKRAGHYLAIMRSQTAAHQFTTWSAYSRCLLTYRDVIEGRTDTGSAALESSLDALMSSGFRRVVTPLIVICAEVMIAEGRQQDAVTRLTEALNFCSRVGERYFLPEVRRALGVAAQAAAAREPSGSRAWREHLSYAQTCYRDAIALARAQGALMWELRATLEMARLLGMQNRISEAIAILEAISGPFDPASRVVDVKELFRLMRVLRSSREQPADDAGWCAELASSVRRGAAAKQLARADDATRRHPDPASSASHPRRIDWEATRHPIEEGD